MLKRKGLLLSTFLISNNIDESGQCKGNHLSWIYIADTLKKITDLTRTRLNNWEKQIIEA